MRQAPTQALAGGSPDLGFRAVAQIEMIKTFAALRTELLDKDRVLVRDRFDLLRQALPLDRFAAPALLRRRLAPRAQPLGKLLGFIESRPGDLFDAIFVGHRLERIEQILRRFLEIADQRLIDRHSVAELAHVGPRDHCGNFLLHDEALLAARKSIAEIEEEIDVLRIANLVSQLSQIERVLIGKNLCPGAALAYRDA